MSTLQATDHEHLFRAIELAEGGRGRTSPNPLVGAVIVRDGHVLGEGFHTALGEPHAERAAIAAAGGADLRGATLYVSLEPCCHTGRTPPCTDAILEAGFARVVVASDDPTEKAAGRGPGILRDEGIDVALADGDLASRARALYDARRAGLKVTGYAADRRDYGRVMRRLQVREAAARVKTLGDAITSADPHFLGTEIPITGDGRISWGD